MTTLGIILLLTHAVDFISANSVETSDCISLEQTCLKDPKCEASYNVFKNCSETDFLDSVSSVKCKNATEILSKNHLMTCKCHRKRKEEICLNIYWTLHPNYFNGYLGSYDSPYIEEEADSKGVAEYAKHSESSLHRDSKNACLKEASTCNDHEKCTKFKNQYVMHCSSTNTDGSCDQRKCHQHLRQFFTKVSMEFTKRLLFCPCNQDSACAERRRQNIVPKCSFEEKNKKNCLAVYDACMRDNLCKSRLLDYRKNCYLFDKKTDICPSEKHSQCIQSYMGMIGTVMTPNFMNNSMETSLWCTCEGSANREDECKSILAMFTSNKCLKNSIEHNLLVNVDEEFPMASDDKLDTSIFVPSLNQVPGTIDAKVLPPVQQATGNTASGVSSPSLAFTMFNPALFLWLLKVM